MPRVSELFPVFGLAANIEAIGNFFMGQKGLASLVPTGKYWPQLASSSTHFESMVDASVLYAASNMHTVTIDTLSAAGSAGVVADGSVETGRCDGGDAVLSPAGAAATGSFTDKVAVGGALPPGASYESNMHCMFRIPEAEAGRLIQVTFDDFRVWSGDLVRLFAGDGVEDGKPTGLLLAQLSGIDGVLPPIRSVGPILVEFTTDSNTEECYNLPEPDGWELRFDRSHAGCTDTASCSNHGSCTQQVVQGAPRSICQCDTGWTGADCSHEDCLGTVTANSLTGTFRSSASALQEAHRYENSAACVFEVHTDESTVQFSIELDLEETSDWLEVRAGT
eukprot:COSAG06_NODE_15693_length_1052_cov_1.782791_1_plen_335_part_01